MLLLIPSILRGNYWGESRSWLSSWCKTVSPICVTRWEVIIEVGRGVVKRSFITLHPVTLVEPRTPDRGLGPAQDWRASYQLVWGPIWNPAYIWQLHKEAAIYVMVVQRFLDAFKLSLDGQCILWGRQPLGEDSLTQKPEVSAGSDRASVCMSNPRNCRFVKSYLARVWW